MRRSTPSEPGSGEPFRRSVPPVVAVAAGASLALLLLLASDTADHSWVTSSTVPLGSGFRVAAELAFFCLAPGAALLSLLQPKKGPPELGLVVGVSLSVSVLVAAGMAIARVWHPYAAATLLAAACTAVLVPRIGQRTAAAVPATTPVERYRVNPSTVRVHRAVERYRVNASTVRGHHALSVALLLGGIALWVLALHHVHLGRLAGYGLLNALPVTYYGALALIAAGFVVAVSGRAPAPLLLAAHALALIVVLHGTTAILYPEPRYPYVYKHLGVIDYIAQHGAIDRSADVYHNWPGMFALNAWFEAISGVKAISYAAWAQVFFETFSLTAVLFAIRGVTRDVRLQWTTVWLFLVADWVGQNYLAPQAISFPLVVLVLGLCIRSAPMSAVRETRLGARFRAWIRRLAGLAQPPPAGSGEPDGTLAPTGALIAGAVIAAAVLVSHQLSPVIMIIEVTAFALVTARLPLRVAAVLAAAEVVWVAIAWPHVKHFSVINFNLFPSSRPAGVNFSHALPGVSVIAASAKVAVIAMVLFAIAGAIQRRRSGRLELAPLTFALAPVPAIPLQAYGGEIVYRSYLFVLPWLAFFAAWVCLRGAVPTLQSALRLAVATTLIGTYCLFAYFGLEKINYVTSDDVAIVEWYDQHAPSGSVMAYAAPNLPDRVNANYVRLRLRPGYVPELTDIPQLRRRDPTSADVPAIASFLRGAHARRTYVAIAPTEQNYLHLFGITPRDWMPRLRDVLMRSREFRLVYRHGRGYVFEMLPTA